MKKFWIILGVVAVVGLSVYGNIRQQEKKITRVYIAKAQKGNLTQTVEAIGNIEPATVVDISSSVMGKIIDLPIAEGDSVREGAVLVELEKDRYQAIVKEARASLQMALAQVDLANAQLEKVQSSFLRQKELHERGLISDEAFEQIATEYQVQQSTVRMHEESVNQAKSSLERAQDDLEKTTITSPLNGVVIELNVKKGENVITGTMNNPGTVLMKVADLSAMKMEAEFDEADIVTIRSDLPARVEIDALPDTSFVAKITKIANSATIRGQYTTEEVTNFLVESLLIEKNPQIKSGMTANLIIETAQKDSVVHIPISCLVLRFPDDEEKGFRPNGDQQTSASGDKEKIKGVYVFDGEIVHFRPVETGIADATNVEVLVGLSRGEKVISGPYSALRTLHKGKKVKLMDFQKDKK